jgi:hypothetical protein
MWQRETPYIINKRIHKEMIINESFETNFVLKASIAEIKKNHQQRCVEAPKPL